MDRVIEVKINGNHLSKDNNLAGVQGEANATYLRIEFDEGWDGCVKTLLWLDARGEKTTGRILTADLLEDITESTRIYLAPIPGEALVEWGEILFAVDGYVNGKRQKSAYGKLNVKPGDEFATLEDVTPSQAEQLQAQIDILLSDIGEHATIASDAAATATRKAAEAAASEANARQAAAVAETAQSAAAAARDRAVSAETAAKAAQKVAEDARDVAEEVVSSDFASNTQAQNYANTAESNAKKYTDQQAVKKSGDVMTGKLVSSARWTGALGSDADNASVRIEGGTDFDKGAFLTLHGKDSWGGMFQLVAVSGTDRKDLAGGSDGVLTWDGNTILHTGNMAQYIGVAQASLEE